MTCQICHSIAVTLVIATVNAERSEMTGTLGAYCSHDHLIEDVQRNWEAGRG